MIFDRLNNGLSEFFGMFQHCVDRAHFSHNEKIEPKTYYEKFSLYYCSGSMHLTQWV